MNIFDIPKSSTDNGVRTEAQMRKQREFHYVGSQKKQDGHIMFSYNKVTGEIKQAEYICCKDVDFMTQQPLFKDKIVIEKDCIYLQALNEKNFVKRLKREGFLY